MLCLVFTAACMMVPERSPDRFDDGRPGHLPGSPVETPIASIDEQNGNQYFDFIMAQMERRQGNLEEAVIRLKRSLAARPGDSYLKKELIYLHLQNENQVEALKHADDFLAAHPEDADMLIIAATIRQQTGYLQDAADLLERVLDSDPDRERVYFVLGDLYLKNESLDKAAVVYEKMKRRFPDQWDAYFLLGRVYDQQGLSREAEKQFNKSLSLEPGLLSPRFALIGLYKKRLDDFTEITIRDGETIYSLCREFYGACGSGIIEKVIEANPGIDDINRVGSGQTIRFPHRDLQTGIDYNDTIIGLYKSMLSDYPDEYRASLELALFYHETGRPEKAAELFMALGQESRNDDQILQYVNQLYIESRRYHQARLIINGMRRGAPDHSTLLYLSGILFNREEDFLRAIEDFSRVQKDSSYYSHARLQMALLYEDTGQAEKAAELFTELIAERPDNAALLLYAGSFFERQKTFEKAETLYRRGLEIDPTNADLNFRLGVVSDQAGRKDDVIRYMKEVLRITPDDANALNYLGYTYAEMGVNLDEARVLIEKAMALDPDNGYITDSLGWVYYQKGNIEKAIKYLEEAVRLIPDDPVLLDHLGDAHARNGELEKALEIYRLSLKYSEQKNNADSRIQEEVRKKIEDLTRGIEAP